MADTFDREDHCRYCGMPADSDDHVPPRWLLQQAATADGPTRKQLLAGWPNPPAVWRACRECNSFLGHRRFKTLAERRKACRAHIRKKYRKFMAATDWTPDELAELGPTLRSKVMEFIQIRDIVAARLSYGDPVSYMRACLGCGVQYAPYRDWQRFCTTTCRVRTWQRDHPRLWRAA